MDWQRYRNQFPVTEHYAYFQHPAVTALPRTCREAINDFLDDQVKSGCLNERNWREQVDSIRDSSAKLLNVSPDRIGFVRNTSHGLSMIAESIPRKSGYEVAVPDSEFPANVYPWLNLERKGIETRMIPMRDGGVYLDDIKNNVTERTELISLSSVQFHSGFRARLEEIGQWCKQREITFVVDGIQSLGWDPLDLSSLPVDALVADAHKWLCGPEGIGICYLEETFQEWLEWANVGWNSVKKPYRFERIDFDLKSEASVMEEGSFNHLGLMGLGASLELLLDIGVPTIRDRNLSLTEVMADVFRSHGFNLPRDKWEGQHDSPILVAHHNDYDEKQLVDKLTDRGIQLSYRGNGIRVGLHFYNNREDVHRVDQAFDDLIG